MLSTITAWFVNCLSKIHAAMSATPETHPPLHSIGSRSLWRYLLWLPPLITLSLVLALHIDVPYYDQWDLLPLLDAYYQHRLTCLDFLQPHNGHILFFPRITMLTLALLTHWNTLAEVLFTFACMLVNWMLLQKIGQHLLNRKLAASEQLLLSLLVFSLAQGQNWLWGWQLQIPLALFWSLLGFLALTSARSHWTALVCGSLCGIIATMSFAGSLSYWLAGLPLLWQRQPRLIAPWACIGASVLLLYAWQVGAVSSDGSISLPPASDALRHLRNTLAIIGGLGARYSLGSAAAVGALMLVILATHYIQASAQQRAWILALISFVACNALLTSMQRAGLGDEQMLATRYTTLTLPMWVAAGLSAINITTKHRHAVLLILLLGLTVNSFYGSHDLLQMHRRMLRGSEALANIGTTEGQRLLPRINPRQDQQQAMHEVKLLQQYRLSFYRRSVD